MFELLPTIKGKYPFQKGFTLIELLIVVGIIGILLIITLSRIGNFGSQTYLDTTAQRVISTLERARNQTLASEDATVYGVHFETTKYVLFKGATYDPFDTNNKEYDISSTTISNITLASSIPPPPAGADVVFDRVRGTTSNSGSVTLQLVADTSKTKVVVINALGQTSLQETSTTPTSRVTDTRHIHLDLTWNLDDQVDMVLTITDSCGPPEIRTITIDDYINASKFEWEGTVTMCGDDQILRIHSHDLSPITNLSIHRDRRFNDKALLIKVDGTRIISYDAAGVASQESVGSPVPQ